MGYLTQFNLETRENITYKQECEIAVELEKLIFGNDEAEYEEEEDPLYTPFELIFEEQLKWYNHRADMKKISIKFPDILFILTGHGEQPGDLWREYHLNGKVQYEKAKFDDFDERKLM